MAPHSRTTPNSDAMSYPIGFVRPSPENDELYRPANRDGPEIQLLTESIREHGVLEPLVITMDGFILSGHRRHLAARLDDPRRTWRQPPITGQFPHASERRRHVAFSVLSGNRARDPRPRPRPRCGVD
ncbi:MAG: hypothetical protein FJ276_32205 [Planctomycetes bacterium]|nr:hypothetical protein [Planctomycetota bacterium]